MFNTFVFESDNISITVDISKRLTIVFLVIATITNMKAKLAGKPNKTNQFL